jgi:hypothetical protein
MYRKGSVLLSIGVAAHLCVLPLLAGEATELKPRADGSLKPRILAQPRNTVVGEHDTAVFETVLNDSAPYSRIIWHNSNPLEGPHEIPSTIGIVVDEPRMEIENCLNNQSYNGKYWIAVTNSAGGTKSIKARLTVVGPPRVATEPRDRTVRVGRVASFSFRLVPDKSPTTAYQWFKDGKPIAGAVQKSLVLPGVQSTDEGNYYCVVTTIGGSVSTWGVMLTVVP